MQALDIIIVAHNSGELLFECVCAALASNVPVKVVVVDNASTDASLDRLQTLAEGDQRLVLLRNGMNQGFSAAANRGVATTSADFVLLLNPDCLIEPDTLDRMLELADAHKDAGMFGCLIRNFDGSEQVGCRRAIPTPAKALARVLHWRRGGFDQVGAELPAGPVPVEAISGAFMLVRRSAIDKVGPLDDGYFLHCEDLDWCERFNRAGQTILFVPGVEVRHAKGASSAGRPIFVERHKHAGMLRFYRKFFRDAYPAPLWWLVWAAVWTRFALKAAWIALHRLKGRKGG